jgi:CDGSH-type Zn-finger protein
MSEQPRAKYRIKVTPDGPYIISGNIPMSKQVIIPDSKGYSYKWEEGIKYPDKEQYMLCRCGHSGNKPYCDGTHATIEWNGTETASTDDYLQQARRLRGPKMDLTDVQRLCASGRFCDRGLGTWKLTQKSDNPENHDMAIQQACDCPSGRLVAWDKETGQAIEPDFDPSIGIIEDPKAKVSGPIWARGGIPVQACDGTEYEVRNRVTLCRCGRSENKPFCDATHVLVGFSDE